MWIRLIVEEIIGGVGLGLHDDSLDTLDISDPIIDSIFILRPEFWLVIVRGIILI